MGEAPNQPYGRDEVNYATNVSAFLGWLIYSIYSLSGLDSIVLAFFWLLLFAVVGLPIAFLASWLVARPILLLIMRKPVSSEDLQNLAHVPSKFCKFTAPATGNTVA